MPDEEMEITTDLAQPGFAEDIDIDLDFAQADEDMELADFETFNSDGRDELMGEGDDESYGMIDADDIAHNEAAAAANDIEIDIGGSDEHLLPDVTDYGASNQVNAHDFAPNMGIDDQNLESGDWFQTTTDQAPGLVETTQVESVVDTDAAGAPNVYSVQETMALPAETTTLPADTTALPVETVEPPASGNAEENDGFDLEEGFDQAPAVQDNVEYGDAGPFGAVEEGAMPTETSKDTSDGKPDEEYNDVTNADNHPVEEEPNASEPVEQVQPNSGLEDEANPPIDGDLKAQLPVDNGESTANLNDETNQADDDLYDEQSDSEAYAKEGDVENKASLNGVDLQEEVKDTDHHPNGTHEDPTHEPALEAGTDDALAEDAASIATRHEMYISYGQTDYRLFARGEDDDPNQYFLKDTSALELSLAGFLTSLREVISEEVSPLDELAMHIDGLGLEFAESTTSHFLEGFTFGTILKLYDDLVKNDEGEAPPDLYCYLMVRPNCSQRLMALLDSANTGRGLSEIAVYRDSTPFDEGHDSVPGSPALSESFNHEAVDVAHEHDDTKDDAEAHVDENDLTSAEVHEDHGIGENANAEADIEPIPVSEANAQGVETTKITEASTDHPPEADEGDSAGAQRPEDDLLDFSDDELDLSPSKQGNSTHSLSSPLSAIVCTGDGECQCEACFLVELERLDASWRLCIVPKRAKIAKIARPSQTIPTGSFRSISSENSNNHPSIGFDNEQNTNISYQDDLAEEPLDGQEAAADDTQASSNETTVPEATTGHMPPTKPNGSIDVSGSESTSVTATLNGDERDEIDYSDDEDDVGGGEDEANTENLRKPALLKVIDDEEITWESENEEAKNGTIASAPKGTVQVSSPQGKRTRAQSEDGDDEQSDVKRRRS